MLDARQVFRKVTRKIYDFSPEQLTDLTAVVWLYRGQHGRFEALRTLLGFADQARALSTQLDHATRATLHLLDEDFDFAETMKEIHAELSELDSSAQQLATRIQTAAAGLLA